jgi:hypothetical protein
MGNAAHDATDEGPGQGEQYSLETVLTVFERRADQARPLTANDVIEELGCSRRTAHDKLNALVEDGRLATRKVGARSRVWWVPLPRDERQVGLTDPAELEREPAVEIGIATAELPASTETIQSRRDALRAAYDYLREHPNTTKSQFLRDVFPEHPADYRTADEWWEAIEPELEDLPNVDIGDDRIHIWYYTGG